MEFQVEHRNPSVAEFQVLRESAKWSSLTDAQVEKALAASLFAVTILYENQAVASGRVIGDGGIYYYLQDIVVLPEFQGKGLGRRIMQEIEAFISRAVPPNAVIGLMSAVGVAEFYAEFGYKRRPENGPGMYKTV